jgi:Cu/Ag efflux pump CusA
MFLMLPGALAGGGLVAHAMGGEFALATLLAVVAILGIAIRGAILMIGHYQRLVARPEEMSAAEASSLRTHFDPANRFGSQMDEGGGEAFNPALVNRAAAERFTPVLMSAVIISAVMLPLVFLGDVPGNEMIGPMAAIVLGGLVTAMFFTLVAVPAAIAMLKPTGGPELEDLASSLIGEQELREAIAGAHVAAN